MLNYCSADKRDMEFRGLHRITRADADSLELFIKKTAERTGAAGAVVGISGGIDSAVVVKLCADALGPENVQAIFMPTDVTPEDDYRQTRMMCEMWNVHYEVVNIQPAVDAFSVMIHKEGDDPLQMGNMMARCRMIVLYDRARRSRSLVYGTTNRSEYLMGYMTKFGDGAEDVTPMFDLYKTQVWQIAEIIGVPQEIIDKVPTAGLWKGQTDEDEMGVTYRSLDLALNVLVQGGDDQAMADAAGISVSKAKEIRSQVAHMEHKHGPSILPDVRIGRD